ncbi:unnamed protein product [Parnassius apollo]|uniref:acid phosphatase n=1 Tax=Parnassius apollo TaxID=110799 RepID=A0A8S3XCR2_PARAO|nr:unnamed protein product [Parnassius apollo]
MFSYLVLVYLVVHLHNAQGNAVNNEVINDKEMSLAFVVNRHGERTPSVNELSLSGEKEKLKNLTYIEGFSGLTNVGKRTAYQIGKFIRHRYGSQGFQLLSNIYHQNEISVRSTGKERTKMTAGVALAAVYPPEVAQQWDEVLGKVWQPVPYSALPLSEDYLLYFTNCKRFKDLLENVKKESIHEEFVMFNDLIPILKTQTGRNFTENPMLFLTIIQLFRSQVALGIHVPQWAKPILARLDEASILAYKLFCKTDEMKRIGGGVMLNDFISAANEIIAGKTVTKRFRLFSAHDFNVRALMDVTNITQSEQIAPDYGSLFAIELYKSKSSGQFTVLPVYLPKAGESDAQYLHFTGCENDNYCDYKHFADLTKEYLLPEKEFYKICNIKTEL